MLPRPLRSTLFPYTTLFRSMLTHLEEDYKSITIVTHSNGGLVAMRALLDRAKDFPAKQPHKIHRIVMFTPLTDRKSTRLNSSHRCISYAVFCLKKKNRNEHP